jgi:hypothetical protein
MPAPKKNTPAHYLNRGAFARTATLLGQLHCHKGNSLLVDSYSQKN